MENHLKTRPKKKLELREKAIKEIKNKLLPNPKILDEKYDFEIFFIRKKIYPTKKQ